eukprot:g22836.t1
MIHGLDGAVLTLPEEEVLVTETFTVTVTAGCGCSLKVYQIQVFGLRLRFELAKPQVDDGHRLQVVVTYNNDALPAELWNDLILYLGPFPQADPLSQVYVLLTTISGAGKDLPLELRLGGALVGQAAESISFAAPFVNCISTVGYGQCTVEELENNEVFVGTLGETMLYVKGRDDPQTGGRLIPWTLKNGVNPRCSCRGMGFGSDDVWGPDSGAWCMTTMASSATSEVCTSLIRVNQTHLLCEMKPRIDLTPAKCRDVDIVVAWGDLTTEMQTVPLKLPEPEIQAVEDMTPGRPLPIEVGDLTYRLDGINFGTPENGRMQVLVGDRSCEVTIRADQQLFCVMNGPLRHWANLGNVLFGTLGTVPKFIYKTKTMLHVFDLNFSP